jgi:hypothetical protein
VGSSSQSNSKIGDAGASSIDSVGSVTKSDRKSKVADGAFTEESFLASGTGVAWSDT